MPKKEDHPKDKQPHDNDKQSNQDSSSSELSQSTDSHNKKLGLKGEEAAARYLTRRGYTIIERNWTCFAGEADIIARDGDTVVFVEVKTRSSADKGFPSEAVTAEKRDRYERIALTYLADYHEVNIPVRFDVISIVAMSKNRAMVRHHVNAFSMEF